MIIFDQPQLWEPQYRQTVTFAAEVVGVALSPYTGLDAAASFERVFGDVRVRFTKSLQFHALALYGVIRFRSPDVITLPLVVHELGHLFGSRAKNKPTKQIAADQLDTTAGSLWPGMHPPSLTGYNAVEKFVNLFADWCMDRLAPDEAGDALRAWMNAHMGEWVAEVMG